MLNNSTRIVVAFFAILFFQSCGNYHIYNLVKIKGNRKTTLLNETVKSKSQGIVIGSTVYKIDTLVFDSTKQELLIKYDSLFIITKSYHFTSKKLNDLRKSLIRTSRSWQKAYIVLDTTETIQKDQVKISTNQIDKIGIWYPNIGVSIFVVLVGILIFALTLSIANLFSKH